MKKIVIVCRRYIPGTAWTNRMLCYAKGLVECGFRVEIVFLITDKKRSSYTLPIPNIIVHNLWEQDSWLAKKNRLVSYLINTHRLKSYLHDATFCLMFDAGGLFVNIIKRCNYNVKVVVEITEHPEIWTYPNLFKRIIVDRQLQMIKMADHVLVITQSLKEYVVKQGVDKDFVSVVNIFVDAERFESLSKKEHNNTIVYCGTLGYKKDGLDILLKAFSLFLGDHPDYQLLLYGKGENEKTIPSLMEYADILGITQNVFFKGYTPYELMPQELINAKILALSRPQNIQNDNGFPTKLGEYLLTSNPVVVTSVGEIPLFIKDGECGYLAKPGDATSFAEKLSFVADNYDEASKVGKRGQELAYKYFSYYNQVSHIFCEKII